MFLGLLWATNQGGECLIFKYPKSPNKCNVFLKLKDDCERTVSSCINCREIYKSLSDDEKNGSQKPASIPVVNGCYFDSDPAQAIHLPGCSPSPFDAVMERFDLATVKSPSPKCVEQPASHNGNGLDEDHEQPLEMDRGVRGDEPNATVADRESTATYPVELCKAALGMNPIFVCKFRNDAGQWKCYRFYLKGMKQSNVATRYRVSCAGCMAVYQEARKRKWAVSVSSTWTDGYGLFTDPLSNHVHGCVPLDYNDVIAKCPLVSAEGRELFLRGAAPVAPKQRKASFSPSVRTKSGLSCGCESAGKESQEKSRAKRRCTLSVRSYEYYDQYMSAYEDTLDQSPGCCPGQSRSISSPSVGIANIDTAVMGDGDEAVSGEDDGNCVDASLLDRQAAKETENREKEAGETQQSRLRTSLGDVAAEIKTEFAKGEVRPLPPSDIHVASTPPTPISPAPLSTNNKSSTDPARRIPVAATIFKKKFDPLFFAQDEVEVSLVEGRLLQVSFEKKISDDDSQCHLYKAKLPDHVDIHSLTSYWKNGSLVVRGISKHRTP